jgi:predicted lipoprotein with Yx(FWY)xxD motif
MLTNENASVARTSSRERWTVVSVVVLAAIATLVLTRPGPGNASFAKGTLVTTATNSLGRILVDPRGRTLYLFEKDKTGASTCVGRCATYWSPLLTRGRPLATAGVKAKLLSTTRRSGGRLQVTYAGHPLYTFKLDAKPGQAKGEGMDAFGAEWYVLATSGAKVEERHAPATSTGSSAATNDPATTNGDGYGYGY